MNVHGVMISRTCMWGHMDPSQADMHHNAWQLIILCVYMYPSSHMPALHGLQVGDLVY